MKYLFSALILFHSLQVFSQNQKWDSTYRPANFSLRVSQFRSYPQTKNDIIFIGNSITERTEWSELLSNPKIKNRGISSDITFGILERLDEVTARKPCKVFILIGINDISRNIPDSVILNNYYRIIKQIKNQSPKTKIFFHTILPVNNEFTPSRNQFNKDEHIEFVNEGLKRIAAKEKVTVIDLHPHFLDATKKLDKKYTPDGLHLNAEGYQVWKQILLKGKYLKD